jgi:hypothetical protein
MHQMLLVRNPGAIFWVLDFLGSGFWELFEFPRTPFFGARISQNPRTTTSCCVVHAYSVSARKPRAQLCRSRYADRVTSKHDYVVLSLTWRRRTTIGAIKFRIKKTTNFSSFATNGKNWSIRKEQKGFLAHPKWAKRLFWNAKELLFEQKHNKSSTKATKAEERRAFENLSAHFGCAKNPLSIPKRTECCK